MNIFRINLFFMLFSPLIAILFGIYIAYYNELSIFPFSSNIVSVLLGLPLSILIAYKLKIRFERNIITVSFISFILIGISFLFSGIDGHRWIFAGNIPLDISMLIAPITLYLISKSLNQRKFFAVLLATSIGLLLVAQPDAGQTTAFGFGAAIIFLFTRSLSYLIRLFVFIIISAIIILAWCQPDALPAINQVELIVRLALKMGILGILGIIVTLFLLIAPLILALKQQKKVDDADRILALAYMGYFLTQFIVTGLGNFPVPIIGAGAAPVLGWYIILGFLIVNKSNYDIAHYDK
ncbi:hypothetical protein ACQUW5_13000 [Legionella sp. CNM-1927-20]|uniref:hypothetical protein n=1 Tax=Legionella sp. CNM-1927-20 TaxID=3422221 RepID=UPI00403AC979